MHTNKQTHMRQLKKAMHEKAAHPGAEQERGENVREHPVLASNGAAANVQSRSPVPGRNRSPLRNFRERSWIMQSSMRSVASCQQNPDYSSPFMVRGVLRFVRCSCSHDVGVFATVKQIQLVSLGNCKNVAGNPQDHQLEFIQVDRAKVLS